MYTVFAFLTRLRYFRKGQPRFYATPAARQRRA
jgi:hypothetical protein